MNPATLYLVQQQLNREIAGLQWAAKQFERPATAMTPEGQRTLLHGLTAALLRTNQLLNAVVGEVGVEAVAQRMAEVTAEAEAEKVSMILLV